MGYDQRIGRDALKPGPGWGGSCLPKDTAALAYMASSSGADAQVLHAAMSANDRQLERVVEKVAAAIPSGLAGAKVAAWGLTFKANTDDLRASPALSVVGELLRRGATVVAHDPMVSVPPLDGLEVVPEAVKACEGADVLVVLTEWSAFALVDLHRVRAAMSGAAVVDARNLLDPAAVRAAGLGYVGIGR